MNEMMEVKRSVWAEMTFLKVILFWLIIPIIVAIVVAKNYVVKISKTTILVESGVFNKNKEEYAVAGITNISVSQSFWGRICNYGTLDISLAGNKRVSLMGIKGPNEVKLFLNEKLTKTANATHTLVN